MMPSQLFKIVRAPEAKPLNPKRVQRLIYKDREDSQWEVLEVELYEGKVVPRELAAWRRKQPNVSNDVSEGTEAE